MCGWTIITRWIFFCAVVQSVDAASDETDEFFGKPSVVSLQIVIPTTSAGTLATQPRGYVRAAVREGTNTYLGVGIHLKGRNGSFQTLDRKPSLTIKFDKFNAAQHFHGLKKIHLNNAAQDPSYFCEIICGDLFRQAAIPATRGTHGRVSLNGSDRGLYVLKEGFDKAFLRRHFKNHDGNLYDTGYRLDIDQRLERITGEDANGDEMLRRAVIASQLPDLAGRLAQMRTTVDMDRFLTFMAMENITVHWDGYAMFKNNYRVYADPGSGKVVFLPHGMDMMFQRPDCSVLPAWDGVVARGLMETAEGQRLYLERLGLLFTNVFSVEKITERIHKLDAALRPALREYHLAASHDLEAQALITRVRERGESLKKQLANPTAFATGEHPMFPSMARPTNRLNKRAN